MHLFPYMLLPCMICLCMQFSPPSACAQHLGFRAGYSFFESLHIGSEYRHNRYAAGLDAGAFDMLGEGLLFTGSLNNKWYFFKREKWNLSIKGTYRYINNPDEYIHELFAGLLTGRDISLNKRLGMDIHIGLMYPILFHAVIKATGEGNSRMWPLLFPEFKLGFFYIMPLQKDAS